MEANLDTLSPGHRLMVDEVKAGLSAPGNPWHMTGAVGYLAAHILAELDRDDLSGVDHDEVERLAVRIVARVEAWQAAQRERVAS